VSERSEATMVGTGDWLLVRARTDSTHGRRGQILEARGQGGGPPYLVCWVDTGVQALVFPGPDAQVMSEVEILELDRQQDQRISRVQKEISAATGTASQQA
jgi:Domain of unknown function (DUF1918)